MSSITISSITFTCVLGGALLGVLLRASLPPPHLSADSKDSVRLGMGLIGTIAALVLGLLIASAKSSFDAQSNELTQLSANIAFLDRVLNHYGPEAKETRELLRAVAVNISDRMWQRNRSDHSGLEPASVYAEGLYDKIQQLSPKTDAQRWLQVQALTLASTVGQARWLMYEQSATSIPLPLLVVLILWLTTIFISFGLFAPWNATVVTSLLIAALSVSGAVLLILEMYKPFEGLIQISSAPLRAALAHLGK